MPAETMDVRALLGNVRSLAPAWRSFGREMGGITLRWIFQTGDDLPHKEFQSMASPVTKHLRRICPTLLVADAAAAAEYYRERLGFTIIHIEEKEFAVVDRDGCRVMLKRGTPAFNRDRCAASMEFYD